MDIKRESEISQAGGNSGSWEVINKTTIRKEYTSLVELFHQVGRERFINDVKLFPALTFIAVGLGYSAVNIPPLLSRILEGGNVSDNLLAIFVGIGAVTGGIGLLGSHDRIGKELYKTQQKLRESNFVIRKD